MQSMSHLRKRILEKLAINMKYLNVRDHCHYTGKYRGATHSIFHLKFNVLYVIYVAFYNGSNYDYHLKKVKSNSNSIWMSWEKYRKVQTFFFPNKKAVIKVDKYGNESVLIIVKFMVTSLWNLVDNLTEGIQKI